jgi:hypothetical protein
MANTGTTGFMEIVNSNIYIPYSTATNYDMILRTDQIQQRMFIGNGSNSSNIAALILSTNNVSINNPISTPGTSNRIWDFSGTISDTSLKPGPVGQNFISGSNISVSTLSPFSNINTEGSIYFQGVSSNYITLPQPTTSALTDMTIETWIYQTSNPVNANGNLPYLIGNFITTSTTNYWSFGINPNNKIAFYNGIGTPVQINGLTTINNNTWNHISFCYSNAGKNIRIFLNGNIETITITGTGTSGNGTTIGVIPNGLSNNIAAPLIIGQFNNSNINAYVANLRVVNNVLYTSSFTPSTYPLQVWNSNNTQLLLRAPLYNPIEHINSIHTHDSLRAHCLPSDAIIYADCYGTNLPNLSSNVPLFDSNITKSIVFNRDNSDFINFGPQTFNLTTKGFTAICKYSHTGILSSYESTFMAVSSLGTNNNLIVFQRNGTSQNLIFQIANSTASSYLSATSVNNFINQNLINNIAIRYDPFINNNGSSSFGLISIWLNGYNTSNYNVTTNVSLSDRVINNITLGYPTQGGTFFNGNIYNLAVYNRALTDKEIIDASMALNSTPSLPNQSTVEIGSASGKSALTVKNDGTLQIAGPINATNNQYYYPVDYGLSNFIIPGFIYGSVPAVVSSPFNGTEGSMYITTSNYINIPNPIFGTSWWLNGGFVCESWVNYPSFSNVAMSSLPNVPLTMGFINSNALTWSVGPNQSSNLTFYYFNGGLNYVIGSNPMQTDTWYHIAVTYDLTTIRIFQNGILQNSSALSGTPITVTNKFTIGGMYGTDPGIANMYITNTRLILGTALYTANFTPSTGPLTSASSGTTALLLRVPQNPGRVLIPKIGGTSKVQPYPPAAITGYSTNIQNTSYGYGYYIISASTDNGGGSTTSAWNGFSSSPYWASVAGIYTNAGVYAGSVSTVDIYGNSYSGEWLQIQLPVSITLSSYSVLPQGALVNIPNTWNILASRDGINWICINKQTGITWGTFVTQLFNVSTSSAFNYYRMVINSTTTSANQNWCVITMLKFYGTQESINITTDGQVGIGITQPIQSLEVAGNAIINGNISAGNLSMFRNRIINGDMRIDQKYNGVGASNIGGGYSAVDRYQFNNSVGGNYNVQRISLGTSDTPYQYGFQNAIRLTTTSANGASGGTQTAWGQIIENSNMSDFQWGTQYAQPATLSFWCKTNFTGNVGTSICPSWVAGSGGEYYHYISFTSNVWQYVNFVIPPPTSLTSTTLSTLSSCGIYIGSFTGGVGKTNNAWNNQFYIGSQEGTWCRTVGNNLTITGLQFEKGTMATPFEFRPYHTELQLCQRYSVVYSQGAGYIGTIYGNSLGGGAILMIKLPQRMRIAPSLNNYSAIIYYDISNNLSGQLNSLAILSGGKSTNEMAVISSSTTSLTQGFCAGAQLSSGFIELSAEL